MTTIAELAVNITANSRNFIKNLDDAEARSSSFSNNISKFMSSAGQGLNTIGRGMVFGGMLAAGAAIAGVTVALKGSVEEAIEARKTQAQLEAVLKSTNGTAGVTKDRANELAESYERMTAFSKETVLGGENMLLTFTSIGKDVFPLATKTALDMSQALGQDMKSSAIQLGKALNDPIHGVTALQRVGVQFTKSQKDTIETLVKSNKLQQAQGMILKELQTEFGGSAEAANTFAIQVEHRIKNLREMFGNAILPSLNKLQQGFLDIYDSPAVQNFLGGAANTIGIVAGNIATAVSVISNSGLRSLFTDMSDGFTFLEGAFIDLGFSIDQAQAWGQTINKVAIWIIDSVHSLATAFQNDKGLIIGVLAALAPPLITFAISTLAALLPAIIVMGLVGVAAYYLYTAWTQNWGGIREKTAALWAWLQPLLQNLWNWLSVNVPLAIQTLANFWTNTLVPAVKSAWNFIQGIVSGGMQFVNDLISGKLGLLSLIFTVAWSNIQLIFAAFRAAFNGDWYQFGSLLRTVWDNTWMLMAAILNTAWAKILTAFHSAGMNFQNSVSTLIKNVVNFFKTTDWGAVGNNIVKGISNGMVNAVVWIVKAAQSVGNAALNAIKGFLGIHSPSQVFEMQVGMQMAAGTAQGWKNGLNTLLQPSFGLLQPAMVPIPSVTGAGGVGSVGKGGGALGGGDDSHRVIELLEEISKKVEPNRLGRIVRDAVLMRSQ